MILTFFPENDRVENQAFGRCARQGDPGSCGLMVQTDQSLSDLFSKGAQKVKEVSLERFQRAEIEKGHHHFLSLFWEQLQDFYRSPLERFSKRAMGDWLEKVKKENRIDPLHLNPVETLLQRAQEGEPFQKEMQSYLGHLAQRLWAHLFYDSLIDLDLGTDLKAFYEAYSPVWQAIFEIKDRT